MLVDLANLRGGPDNITVIIARVIGAAMTTAASGQLEPLTVASKTEKPAEDTPIKSKTPLWIAAGVCLVAAVVLGIFNLTLPAVASVLAAVAVGAFAFLQRFGPTVEPDMLVDGARLGQGPHTAVDCPPNAEIVSSLAEVVDQLKDAATEGSWTLDWNRFNVYRRHAGAAAERKDYRQAVCEYGRALRFMMHELRNQRKKRNKVSDSDSSVL